jgi:hypothetical protein
MTPGAQIEGCQTANSANNIHAILPIHCNYLGHYMSDHIIGAQNSEDQNNGNTKVETQKSDSSA